MFEVPENVAEEAKRAKNKLIARADEVKGRMTPASLMADAKAKAQMAARKSGNKVRDTIRANPGASVGAVAAIALLLFHKPVFGAMRRLMQKENKDG